MEYGIRQHNTLTGHGRVREDGLSLTAAKKKLKERVSYLEEDLGVTAQKVNDMRYEFHCRNYMVVVSIEEMGEEVKGEKIEEEAQNG